jgi:SAM-dependent methyltransferase
VKGKPARETLLAALERFERESRVDGAGGKRAIDLGCGEGRDTAELVARGWRVLALDGHPEGIARTLERLGPEARGRVEARVARFEDLADGSWKAGEGEGVEDGGWDGGWELVNASFALPFCAPERFGAVWRWVVGAITPGGRFCGQLFGDRDEWATIADRTHHRRGELDGLFAGFVLEELREEEKDSPEVSGRVKHWHVFHVVARKM